MGGKKIASHATVGTPHIWAEGLHLNRRWSGSSVCIRSRKAQHSTLPKDDYRSIASHITVIVINDPGVGVHTSQARPFDKWAAGVSNIEIDNKYPSNMQNGWSAANIVCIYMAMIH